MLILKCNGVGDKIMSSFDEALPKDSGGRRMINCHSVQVRNPD